MASMDLNERIPGVESTTSNCDRIISRRKWPDVLLSTFGKQKPGRLHGHSFWSSSGGCDISASYSFHGRALGGSVARMIGGSDKAKRYSATMGDFPSSLLTARGVRLRIIPIVS